MIIIKTKTGDTFVNDKEIISVQHNREAHTAYISKPSMGTLSMLNLKPIEQVQSAPGPTRRASTSQSTTL